MMMTLFKFGFFLTTSSAGNWETGRRTVGQDCQKCKETSSPLADKQQKRGEHVENIKFTNY